MLNNEKHLKELQSPLQSIKGRVEIYKGSTLETTCTCDDVLSSFTVEKEGENKFFGFGICQKLNMELIGADVPLAITKEHEIKVALGAQNEYLYPYPIFYIQKPEKDAETDDVTLTAYDALYYATEYRVADLAITAPYTVREFAEACASLLGITFGTNVTDSSFNTEYPEGANFEGTETLREALNAIAEVTQTIYYMDSNNQLFFKRLDKTGEPVWTIDRNSYESLKNGESSVLSRIVHATELGDNVAPETAIEGVTQYIRNNPFWDLREDVAILVENAQAIVEGFSIDPFECEWFGNHLLEIGDKIKLITRKGAAVNSYLLSDSITYNGSLSESTSWAYEDNEAETATNPTSIGEALNQTYARVDKVNKEIALQAGKVDANASAIASLQITTEGISTNVNSMQTDVQEVKTTVATVKSTAENAQSVANTAKSTAETAQSTASGANATANTAKETAESAKSTADSAKDTAENAQSTANTAKDTADSLVDEVTTLATKITTAETKIDQKADSITLEALQNEVTTINGEVEGNTSAIAALQINTESISASVTKIEENVKTANEATNEELANIKQELELKVTAEDVTIEIKKELEDGVDKVTTSTGFTFNEEGLSIERADNEVNTLISHDGMKVFRQGEQEAVLVANNEGVNAENLHATTYLIIGENSRFEDYNNNTRTGCFWIGS